MTGAEILKTELETYEREKTRLVAAHEGKYVVIHGGKVAGVWDTYEDALRAGYTEFALKPFLVKQVQAVEQVQVFTRDFAT